MVSSPLRRLVPAGVALLALVVVPPARGADVRFHGLLDIVAAERGEAYGNNVLTRGDSPFDAYGLRLFAESSVGDRLAVYAQLVFRGETDPYVDGAYLQWTPSAERDLHLQAGKVPWPIGTWAPRTYSTHNPLIGVPLLYQYHSTLLWYELAPSVDALLAASGSGQTGVNYFGYAERLGMPVVDDSYWDVGVVLQGSQRPFEYAAGVTAGTPGWGSTSQDENSGKSFLGRIGIAPLPGVRFGLSGAYGPYLVDALNPNLPAGRRASDYHQKLGMADLELLAGHAELRAEGALNTWETPRVGNLEVATGYAELKYSFSSGAFLAGRWDVLRFGDVRDSTGRSLSWDANVTRLETGLGYRLNRDAIAKVVVQRDRIQREAPPARDRTVSLVALQVSVAF